MTEYQQRDSLLLKMGFDSYSSYLQSQLWKSIRAKVFEKSKSCVKCNRNAHAIHHSEYTQANLCGRTQNGLYPVCMDCHEQAEVDWGLGIKRRLWQANVFLLSGNPTKKVENPKTNKPTPKLPKKNAHSKSTQLISAFSNARSKVRNESAVRNKCLSCNSTAKKGRHYCRSCQHRHKAHCAAAEKALLYEKYRRPKQVVEKIVVPKDVRPVELLRSIFGNCKTCGNRLNDIRLKVCLACMIAASTPRKPTVFHSNKVEKKKKKKVTRIYDDWISREIQPTFPATNVPTSRRRLAIRPVKDSGYGNQSSVCQLLERMRAKSSYVGRARTVPGA